MKKYRCIFWVAGVMLCVGAAQASIIQTSNNSTDPNAFVEDRVADDLIGAGEATLSSVSGDPAYTTSGAFSVSGLNDGSSAVNYTDGTGKTFYDSAKLPATITFVLDTTINAYGYNITNINTYAGWGGSDATQANQSYEILVSTVGSAAFSTLATVDYAPFSSGTSASTIVSLTDDSGILATGVDAIRFEFADNSQGNGTVYQELDVFGVVAVPEPAAVALISSFGVGVLFIRRRFL